MCQAIFQRSKNENSIKTYNRKVFVSQIIQLVFLIQYVNEKEDCMKFSHQNQEYKKKLWQSGNRAQRRNRKNCGI